MSNGQGRTSLESEMCKEEEYTLIKFMNGSETVPNEQNENVNRMKMGNYRKTLGNDRNKHKLDPSKKFFGELKRRTAQKNLVIHPLFAQNNF